MKGGEGHGIFAYDLKLLFPVLFLVGIGVVMVYSASSALALNRFGSDYYFLKRQGIYSAIGIFALLTCCHLPIRFLRSMVYPILFLALLFLAAILFSEFGYSAGGSSRWLRFGSFTFQPSEFARFAIVVYLAYSMSRKSEKLNDFMIGFFPHVAVLSVFSVLILLQPDFGSVVILAAVTWIMMFVGGVPVRHLLSAGILLLPAAYYFMMGAKYRIRRILSFLDPWQYPADEGYQIVHSLMAFGTGGVWGAGIGKGYQKLFYLPEPHTDFIFSVIGEELGLAGVLLIIGLYALIFWRGLLIAKHAGDPFTAFLAAGLTISLGLQAVVNMGVTLGLLPTKGLTLPFLSYGGTSLVLNMAAIGILMNIGTRKPG
jgi:cell division protein FtsW